MSCHPPKTAILSCAFTSYTEVSQKKTFPKTIIDNGEWKATIPAKNLPNLASPSYNIYPIAPFPIRTDPRSNPPGSPPNLADTSSEQN